MRILNKYLLRECATTFAVALCALVGMLFTIKMLHFTSLVVNKGVDAAQIGNVFLAIIPTFLQIALPMSVLLGTLIATSRLSGDSELIVIRASGISLGKLVKPIILFGSIAVLGGWLVSFYLKPWGHRHLSETIFDIARSKSTAGLEAGIFNDLGPITLYAEDIDFSTGGLNKVIIDDRREESARKVIVSHAGTMSSNRAERTISLHLKDGAIHEKTDGGGYVITKFDIQEVLMDADQLLGDDDKKESSSQELALPALRGLIRTLNEDPDLKNSKKLRRRLGKVNVELATRYSMPFASLVLAIIGFGLGIIPPRTQRTWGIGASIALSLSVFVLYYGILSLGISTMSDKGLGLTTVGVWLPNIIFAILAWYFIKKLSTEKWSSILDAPGYIKQRWKTFRQ